jgi:HNH endonuclease
MRYADLGKPVVECGYCGSPVIKPGATKFCSPECYYQKVRSQPVEQRFWARVDRSGECWLWTGGVWNSGYGQFMLRSGAGGQKNVGAHQYSYELANGPIPEGLEVLHSCDQRLCVNPAHLRAGTHLENVREAAAKGKYRVPRPKKQKLTVEQIAELRSLVAAGEKQFRVAERFGVSEGYVSRIMRGTLRQYDAPIEKAS